MKRGSVNVLESQIADRCSGGGDDYTMWELWQTQEEGVLTSRI